jgi:short-subunit dehydrogenase
MQAMEPSQNLAQRCFVITGAGRGLGAAFAMVLADAGARVVLTGRSPDTLSATRDAIGERTGQRPEIAILDLSDPLDAAQKARDLAAATPGIDGLINNAATWQSGGLEEHDDAEIAAVINAHVTGTLLVTKALAPSLTAAPVADIVNIVSTSALPNVPLYGVSVRFHAGKHGQRGLSEALRQHFSGTGVRVTALYPPDLDTMTPLDPEWDESPHRGYDRKVTSRDVVETALFAMTRPRNCTLSRIVLDSDIGGLYPDGTPRHGETR